MKRMQLLGLCLLLSTSTAQAVEPKINPNTLSPDMVSNTKAKPANINFKALHRLDFVIKGKSCPVCLLKMQKRLNETTGVVKVAVMLRKPYGGVVIYDSTKLEQKKILDIAKDHEPAIEFVQVEDEAIPKVPVILIPHHGTEPQN
jgi:hypothetical protein